MKIYSIQEIIQCAVILGQKSNVNYTFPVGGWVAVRIKFKAKQGQIGLVLSLFWPSLGKK